MANTVIGGETCIWNSSEANAAADMMRSSSVSMLEVPDGCTLSNPFKAERTYPVASGNPAASGKAGYSPSRFRNHRGERSPAPSQRRKPP